MKRSVAVALGVVAVAVVALSLTTPAKGENRACKWYSGNACTNYTNNFCETSGVCLKCDNYHEKATCTGPIIIEQCTEQFSPCGQQQQAPCIEGECGEFHAGPSGCGSYPWCVQ